MSYQMKIESFIEAEPANRRYSANKEHLYSDLNGEAVILSLKNGKYYGVNGVGAFIWSSIQEPVTFQDIRSAVMREYDVDEAICQLEVSSFLEKMTEEGLVEVFDEKNT